MKPILAAVIALLATLPPTGPAVSQSVAPPAASEAQKKAASRLDKLFERLKEAESLAATQPITQEIERAFEKSGSATADLLYERARNAMNAKDFDLALDLFDYIVMLKPDWAEPYHRRAIIHFIRKDEDAALRDVREALQREPRHYHALAGLGGILRGLGDKKGAYRAFSKVLEIHPHFADLKEAVEKMRPEIEGQPI